MFYKWLVSTLLGTFFLFQLTLAQEKEVIQDIKPVMKDIAEKTVAGTPSAVQGIDIVRKHDESLAEAVNTYWNSFISGDLVKCYEFYCKSYRSDVSFTEYVKMENMAISGMTVVGLEKSEAHTLIKFEGKASHESFIFKKLPLKQRWTKENDQWVILKASEKGKKVLPF